MSGPICPDCGSFEIDAFEGDKGKRMNRCRFCGWEGDELPRKKLSTEMYENYRREQDRKRQLRESGKLFFLRIWVSKYKLNSDILEKVTDMFDIDIMIQTHERKKGAYNYCELEIKPYEEIIEKIKKLEGVTKVTVF